VRTGTLTAAALVAVFSATSFLVFAPASFLLEKPLALLAATVMAFAAVVHAHRSAGLLAMARVGRAAAHPCVVSVHRARGRGGVHRVGKPLIDSKNLRHPGRLNGEGEEE
jgi:hypothetical protein